MSANQPLKLSLRSCVGSPRHSERASEVAQEHGVERAAYFLDYAYAGMIGPSLYPRDRGLVPDTLMSVLEVNRQICAKWRGSHVTPGLSSVRTSQVLELPDLEHVRQTLPQLLTAEGSAAALAEAGEAMNRNADGRNR